MNDSISNDNTELNLNTSSKEPILKFDFPGLKIGIAEYENGPTGCTVFYFPKGVKMASDIRGGAPGVIGENRTYADAICFAGGSLWGYEAITGVSAELLKWRNYSPNWMVIPLVSGAIIYDFGPRKNSVYPDKRIGREALKTAVEGKFPLGPQGAGISASVGKCLDFSYAEMAGQGGAFTRLGDTKILVFTVVNALGAIVNRDGEIVRGFLDRTNDERINAMEYVNKQKDEKNENLTTNTTLTLVVTNQKFDDYSLRQAGRQIHASMARAIQPFHAINDGDSLYIVSTQEIENKKIPLTSFGIVASEVAWDAVLNCYKE